MKVFLLKRITFQAFSNNKHKIRSHSLDLSMGVTIFFPGLLNLFELYNPNQIVCDSDHIIQIVSTYVIFGNFMDLC